MINATSNRDVFVKILTYSNNLRFLKIVMNYKNIKYLFENDGNISIYLNKKMETLLPSLSEKIYLSMIECLKSDKNSTLESLYDKIVKDFNDDDIDLEYCKKIIDKIVDDYNKLYLNDYYYYGGYWHEGTWIKCENEESELVLYADMISIYDDDIYIYDDNNNEIFW